MRGVTPSSDRVQTGSFTDQETGHSDVDRDILNTVVSSRHILMELLT